MRMHGILCLIAIVLKPAIGGSIIKAGKHRQIESAVVSQMF